MRQAYDTNQKYSFGISCLPCRCVKQLIIPLLWNFKQRLFSYSEDFISPRSARVLGRGPSCCAYLLPLLAIPLASIRGHSLTRFVGNFFQLPCPS
ncbi:hypothetical protein EUGRSUZ_I01861 [Eucalyptus grandis]|uniref:Uncharacterized protein n=2 Tax=Eucalyptus grandis TaxID=71139 RepID=A0ACC3JHE8_EUCGR|nr:hypothetical protein EUGRSUZ_I01861 [Eucalyptus grandis]